MQWSIGILDSVVVERAISRECPYRLDVRERGVPWVDVRTRHREQSELLGYGDLNASASCMMRRSVQSSLVLVEGSVHGARNKPKDQLTDKGTK